MGYALRTRTNVVNVDFSQRSKDLVGYSQNRSSEKRLYIREWKQWFCVKKSNDNYWQRVKHTMSKKIKTVMLQFPVATA